MAPGDPPASVEGLSAVGGPAHESQERLLGIIASATDAIITVDGNQRVTLFNLAAEQMFRCPASEAVGSTLDRFIPERYRGAHRAHIEAFAKTGVTTRKAVFRFSAVTRLLHSRWLPRHFGPSPKTHFRTGMLIRSKLSVCSA